MSYTIEGATYEDCRAEEFRNLAGHAWVKFDEVNGAGEEFYITDSNDENGESVQYLGRCNSIDELEKLAEKWANE